MDAEAKKCMYREVSGIKDASNIRAAVTRLKAGIEFTEKQADTSLTYDEMDTMRSGVVKHMEMAYELSWKAMQAWLRANASAISREDLFRLAASTRLIADPDAWFRFHDALNLSSHAYNRETANGILKLAPTLYTEALALADKLEKLEKLEGLGSVGPEE